MCEHIIIITLLIIILWFLFTQKERFQQTLYSYRHMTLHYVPWSPLCAEAMSLWTLMKENVRTVKYSEVNEDVAKTPYVYSYPTIFLVDEQGKRHQYKGMLTYKDLSDWALSPSFRD